MISAEKELFISRIVQDFAMYAWTARSADRYSDDGKVAVLGDRAISGLLWLPQRSEMRV